MKFILLTTVLLCLGIMGLVAGSRPCTPTVWLIKNCDLAEISPDFTPKEKADCRIARAK
jgi:hypothetical protein